MTEEKTVKKRKYVMPDKVRYFPQKSKASSVSLAQMHRFVDAVAMGATLKGAAEQVGLSRAILWRQQEYDQGFWEAINRALAFNITWEVLDRIRSIEDKLENGEIDARAGATIINSIQWKAQVLNSRRFGSKLAEKYQSGPIQINVVNFKELQKPDEPKAIEVKPDEPLVIEADDG